MSHTANRLAQESLAFALSGAARVLGAVDAGAALPAALSGNFAATRATPAARGAIQDISYRCMRRWGLSKALMTLLLDAPAKPPRLGTLLCIALGLLSDEDRPYADHTLVDQAVSACGADAELVRAKGLMNAVLRRFLRERARLLAQAQQNEEARWNYPQWWIDKARADWPKAWETLLASGNARPPLTLRVNRRKTTVEAYLALLEQRELAAVRIGESAIRLSRPLPVNEIPEFSSGWVSVQDAAAQLAAPLMDLAPGMRVLDACAAPGGKTGHLLEIADIELLALDQDAERLNKISENLIRLSLTATLKCGDARERDWWDGLAFDRILADVPCTASGIVRRHPDIRWLRRPTDSTGLARLSSEILDNLWSLLRPGGKLLLVTCSVWPEESEQQAERFARRHGAIRLPAQGQLLPTQSMTNDHDGLFYSLLQKPSV